MLNSHRPHYSELGEASLGHEWVDKVISYLPIWSENVPPPLFMLHMFSDFPFLLQRDVLISEPSSSLQCVESLLSTAQDV